MQASVLPRTTVESWSESCSRASAVLHVEAIVLRRVHLHQALREVLFIVQASK
jgi:hypothetical protein